MDLSGQSFGTPGSKDAIMNQIRQEAAVNNAKQLIDVRSSKQQECPSLLPRPPRSTHANVATRK